VEPKFDPQAILLSGRHVRLEPLAQRHAAGLFSASRDPDIWTYLTIAQFAGISDVEKWIDEALQAQRAGSEVAFATVRVGDDRVVGTTRFLDIRRAHRALEIGWTWIDPQFHRTAVNTEAKYLMLRHAFDDHGAVRVQLKTDERNVRSRAAIERIGCSFEGILRNFQTYSHGFVRNTAMFSLTAAEWPAAKARLEAKLAR